MTDNRSDVSRLEDMGYFGDLSENIFQRFKNGVNGVLANAGNARAAGKLDVGQTIVGLEKEYKAWLGANKISNPSLGDFKRYLSLLDQKYNLGLSNKSKVAQSSTNQASSPNTGQPSPAQPASGGQPAPSAPQAQHSAVGSLNPVIQNTLDFFRENIQKNTPMDEQTIMTQVSACLKRADKTGSRDQTIQELNKIVQDNPNNEIAAAISKAIQNPNESRIVIGTYLKEDVDDAKPFSMDQARAVFDQIARQSYDNATFGGGGAPNPASNGGGTPAAGGGSSGGTAANNKNANQHEDTTRRMIPVDFQILYRECDTIGIRSDVRAKLKEFITQSANKSVASAGGQLLNARIVPTERQAFQLIVALLREIHE